MKKIKRILSVFLISIVLSQSVVMPVFAVPAVNDGYDKLWQYFRDKSYNFWYTVSGILASPFQGAVDQFTDWINNHREEYNVPDGQSLEEFIGTNYTINQDNSITMSANFINAQRDFMQNWVDNNTGFVYGYSLGASDYLNFFSDQEAYHAFLDLLNANIGKYIVCSSNGSYVYIWDDSPIDIVYSTYSNGSYTVNPYYSWSNTSNKHEFKYDTISKTYIDNGSYPPSFTNYILSDIASNKLAGGYYVTQLNRTQYIIYRSYDAMKAGTEGVQQYYVSDSYNTSHVDNSMTFTTSQVDNSITYTDVSNYVNNYYIQNTTYPSSQDVYNYINNYDGSGGGSGGGSGSGSDDKEEDDGWDWGWLTSIGDFIKGLFNALSAVISGILDVLTSIIDLFIGTDNGDGTRTGGLPNIIGQLIAYFMPFLPSWVGTLIGFSIVLAVIVGVIRFLRK